jgi:hypothetical protein
VHADASTPQKDERPRSRGPTRKPRAVVLQAELLASSPERVWDWLEHRAADKRALEASEYEEPDGALFARRHEPLIKLALARFGADHAVLRMLFAGGVNNKAVRLAVLMNEVASYQILALTPRWLLAGQSITEFLTGLDYEEVVALFSNQTLSDDFLSGFLEQKDPWQALDETGRLLAITALSDNLRMRTEMQSGYGDPESYLAEIAYNEVFEAAWRLAFNVPVTKAWATVLFMLYLRLRPATVKNPLEMAARWIPDPDDFDQVASESEGVRAGTLGPFAGVRRCIARLAVNAAYSLEDRQKLAAHEDVAVRAALYSAGNLSLEEMRAGFERDSMLALSEMLENPILWRARVKRTALRKMAWSSRFDPGNHLPQILYEGARVRHRESHPKWFKVAKRKTRRSTPQHPEPQTDVAVSRAAAPAGLIGFVYRAPWLGWGIAAILALLLYQSRH